MCMHVCSLLKSMEPVDVKPWRVGTEGTPGLERLEEQWGKRNLLRASREAETSS